MGRAALPRETSCTVVAAVSELYGIAMGEVSGGSFSNTAFKLLIGFRRRYGVLDCGGQLISEAFVLTPAALLSASLRMASISRIVPTSALSCSISHSPFWSLKNL